MSSDPHTGLKIPPHSIESETMVLGVALTSPDMIPDMAEILASADFFRRNHSIIWTAVNTIQESGESVDIVTTAAHLESHGELDRIGGLGYLSEICTFATPVNALSYARIVRERALERDLVAVGTEIASLAWKGDQPLEDRLQHAQHLASFERAKEMAEGLRPQSEFLAPMMADLDYRYMHQGEIHGTETGFTDLDRKLTGFHPGDLVLLAARPSMGKTALALQLAAGAAKSSGKPAAFFSLEMTSEQLITRRLAQESQVSMHALRSGQLSDTDWPRITHGLVELNEAKGSLLLDETKQLTPAKIRSRVKRIKGGVSLVVIDYLGLLEVDNKIEGRVNQVADMSRSLKLMGLELGVPMLVLSQLNRGLEQRQNKRPMLSDLRDSGALEQDADTVMFLYRDEVYDSTSDHKGLAELNIAKQRNGPLGKIWFSWKDSSTRFDSAPPPDRTIPWSDDTQQEFEV